MALLRWIESILTAAMILAIGCFVLCLAIYFISEIVPYDTVSSIMPTSGS